MMGDVFRKLKRILIITYIVVLHLVVVYFVGERFLHRSFSFSAPDLATVPVPTEETPIPTPLPVPSEFAEPLGSSNSSNLQTAPSPLTDVPHTALIIPVFGVKPEQLTDTYSDSRANDRLHDAIDIPAAAGTPVVAAADGEIVKFWDSEAGGITIYQLSADRKFVYYYAHLQRRADEIHEGDFVRQGATIGFVGDTGNAGAGNYHLHFSVARVNDPKRHWEGTYINPYPLLQKGGKPE